MGYQQTTILGNIGSVSELRYTQTGTAVCDFSVAVNKVYGSGENRREYTTWFKVVLWREKAENLHQYLTVGKLVLAAGEVSVEAYTNRQGEPAAKLVITPRDVQLLGGRSDDSDAPNNVRDMPRRDEPTEDIPF
jgi:single-strand DNA-binding protein